MEAKVSWVGEALFLGESGSGHTVVMDGPPEHGGRNLASRPMEMLLIGMGGCATFDVVDILKKSRQDVLGCRAELQAERADEVPAVFTKINIHFVVSGNNLKEKQVARAVSLSAEKYCSASIMLEKAGVEILKHKSFDAFRNVKRGIDPEPGYSDGPTSEHSHHVHDHR